MSIKIKKRKGGRKRKKESGERRERRLGEREEKGRLAEDHSAP